MDTLDRHKTSPIARPPTALESFNNRLVRGLGYAFAALVLILLAYIVLMFAFRAAPQLREQGLGFLVRDEWDSNKGVFGILPAMAGTLYSSVLALILGTVLGVSVAIFLSEGLLGQVIFSGLKPFGLQFHPVWGRLPDKAEGVVKNLIQLLAAIPSVVYGLWGIFVVIPTIRPACHWLHENFGWFPLFRADLIGPGLLPAALVLAIMILPTIAAISRDSLAAVPARTREAAFGLGATRWEAILRVFLPTAAPGIYGSVILGFGRALGETMALAMLAGGTNNLTWALFAPVNTLAALLATNFPEAVTNADKGRLMYAALVLMAITLAVNMLGTYVLQRSQRAFRGAR